MSAGVQFLVDNNPLGAEDTTSPYSVTWNTTTATNGTHTLTALARDVNGNTALSAPVTVNVANAATTAPPAFVQVKCGDTADQSIRGGGHLHRRAGRREHQHRGHRLEQRHLQHHLGDRFGRQHLSTGGADRPG